MRILYTLYSAHQQEGVKLAEVTDESQANVLESYYSRIYNNDRFKVTVKQGRQKEVRLYGFWS